MVSCVRVDIDILYITIIVIIIGLAAAPARGSRKPKNRPGGVSVYAGRGCGVHGVGLWVEGGYCVPRRCNGNVNRQTTDDYVRFLGIYTYARGPHNGRASIGLGHTAPSMRPNTRHNIGILIQSRGISGINSICRGIYG